MESNKRSIAKTISWRICATVITTLVVLFTPSNSAKVAFALEIGFIDTTIKLGIYYLHERIWNTVNYGRIVPKNSDFEI